MAVSVAARSPSAPIIVTYIQEIGRIDADPYGAALTAPIGCDVTPAGRLAAVRAPSTRWPGRNGARCALHATGPTPGPPPPCGMQNVLCRLRCETSAPKCPGAARPTSALRFAPSTYTCPPCAWTISHARTIERSNTPCVDGYVTMIAARS